MKFIRGLLYVCAAVIVLYPCWGLFSPQSYLNELLEVYPLATDASESQVRSAAGFLLLSNLTMALAFVFIGKFIAAPSEYRFAKYAASAFIAYPFVLSFVEVMSGRSLYSHLESPSVILEFSAIKMFYILIGLSLVGIYRSQRAQHQLG